LRQAVFRYPGDFWLQDHLGWVLIGRRKPGEAVPPFRVALGLRPRQQWPGITGHGPARKREHTGGGASPAEGLGAPPRDGECP
jgi:hypothetical protein